MKSAYSTEDQMIGKLIGNKYQIEGWIGSGGMANVYKAIQLNLGREVALKIVHPHLVNDKESVSRFYREAKDLAAISHPNIVTIFDFGVEDGFHFISMELLHGRNLAEYIRMEGRLDELQVVKYLAPIAHALHSLHEQGMIHRDVKSSNIFITTGDRPVLMDFGIAFHKDMTISRDGAILGTAEFMSPEQAKGESLDRRSDIYSIGVVMFECITGRVPFYSENPAVTLYKVINEPPPPFPPSLRVSKDLKSLIHNTLQKDIYMRPQSGEKVYRLLDELKSNSEYQRRYGEEKQTESRSQEPEAFNKQVPFRKNLMIPMFWFLIILFIASGIYVLFFAKKGSGKVEITELKARAENAFSSKDYANAYYYSKLISNVEPTNTLNGLMMTKSIVSLYDKYIQNELVPIPAGNFMMGNENGGTDEKPVHQVSISGLMIGRTEVTNRQYVMFLTALGCTSSGEINGIRVINFNLNTSIKPAGTQFVIKPGEENLPATGITWNGADMFCKTFFGRLPTEAEWEYCAQAGSTSRYSGSDNPDDTGWYLANSGRKPQYVATKRPNNFGLYDMTGNVWEWCSDYYDNTYYSRSESFNPKGPLVGNSKVIRGGDFQSPAELLGNSFRSNSNFGGTSGEAIGFRICVLAN